MFSYYHHPIELLILIHIFLVVIVMIEKWQITIICLLYFCCYLCMDYALSIYYFQDIEREHNSVSSHHIVVECVCHCCLYILTIRLGTVLEKVREDCNSIAHIAPLKSPSILVPPCCAPVCLSATSKDITWFVLLECTLGFIYTG